MGAHTFSDTAELGWNNLEMVLLLFLLKSQIALAGLAQATIVGEIVSSFQCNLVYVLYQSHITFSETQ